MDHTLSVSEETDPLKQDISTFLQAVDALSGPEEKLRASIEFMRSALSQQKAPNFRGFWEVRKFSLPLFKETNSGPIRSQLWGEYIELTREGRRLKNLLDEETAFAVEQIDLAIQALESDVSAYQNDLNALLEKSDPLEFPREPKSLEGKYDYYENVQMRLNYLNVFAARINALRKELLRTEMRIRQKNKFFQRLSTLGDNVFPVRKDLVREISDAFVEDVNRFVEMYFSPEAFALEKVKRSLFFLREEIKTLQALAKLLTLNTQAFAATREQLSESWDKLKGLEKVVKKESSEQKQKSSENAKVVWEKIHTFRTRYQEKTLTLADGYSQLDALTRWLRGMDLISADFYSLKDELRSIRATFDEQRELEEKAQKEREEQLEKIRIEKVEKLKLEVEALKIRSGSEKLDTILTEIDEYKKKIPEYALTKHEKQQIEKSLKDFKDEMEVKKENALLTLSEDDKAALGQLNEVLYQRKERRKEILKQIEEYRKIIGGSGLDIEKAMQYDLLMKAEKERRLKIEEGIKEIEQKIRAITQ